MVNANKCSRDACLLNKSHTTNDLFLKDWDNQIANRYLVETMDNLTFSMIKHVDFQLDSDCDKIRFAFNIF